MRADLLALDDDGLVALANRGLVKRARKEVDRGDGPKVVLEGDVVVATFADGTVSRLPADVPLKDAPCTCGASKVCRHRLAAVMAYRAGADTPAHDDAPLPALEVDDDGLLGRIGKRAWQRALRTRSAGYGAEVRFGRTVEVLLSTCTVRFLVPWELAHIRCDCKVGVDCEHVALAVWAVAEAPSFEGEHKVEVGTTGAPDTGDDAVEGSVLAVQQQLLLGGWTGGGEVLAQRLAVLTDAVGRARMVWVADLLAQLGQVLAEYDDGASTADVDAVGALIGELGLRVRAKGPRGERVGAQSMGATALDHTVLRGVGARYRMEGGSAWLQVFFQEGTGRDALVLEKRFALDEEGQALPGPRVAQRRLFGGTPTALASGHVTTKAATRLPNRLVQVKGQASRQTAVTPGSGASLAQQAESLATVRQRLTERDPASLAARVRAWRVVVTGWTEVETVAWDPGRRVVWGWVADDTDQALVAIEWRPEAPGGAACLARALLAEGGGVLGAEAFLREGRLWLEPLVLSTSAGHEVPDLADDTPRPELPVLALPDAEGVHSKAVHEAQRLLAELAQRGLGSLTSPQLARVGRAAKGLRAVGLGELAEALEGLQQEDRVGAWRRSWARGVVLEQLLACGGRPLP
jgi:hypothetical protein